MTQIAANATHLSLFNPEPAQVPVNRVFPRPAEVPQETKHDSAEMLRLELTARLAFDHPLIAAGGNTSRSYQVVKRGLDIIGGTASLVMFAPIMVVTYIALWFTTKGQPIFKQERVGHCGRKFTMYKFRTMCVDADQKQHLVSNQQSGPVFKNRRDPRITRIGRILRTLSIDEMPQVFNVLRGDMALVGPRPPVAKEVVQYQPWQLKRLAVKPGLTCLWQVSGRCEIGFEDWVRMDIWYMMNQSLKTDLWLLWKTPWSVISGRGAY